MLNKFTKKLGELLPVVVPKQDPQPTSAAADTAPHGDTADQPTATTTATAASTSATPTTTAAATTDAAVAVPSQVEVPVEGKPSDGSSVTGITDTGSGAKVEGKTPGTDAVDTPKDGDDGGSTKTETTPTPTKDGVEPPAPTAEPVTGGDANESGDKEKPSDTPATPQVPVSHYKQRVSQFQEAIFQGCEPATECGIQIINISAVRNMAFGGIPEQNHLREPYWKLLLNYLPLDRAKWDNYLKEQRAIYVKWKEEFFIDPHAHQASNDHPLSTQTSSVWNSFFNDAKIVEDITKDLKRTSPNLHFFTSGERANLHYNALQSILFVYAKLNPGIRYVQGMNEILAPLYYVFASHYQDPQELLNAEADTFFCFTNVMSEIRDHFIKSLDASGIGVHKTLGKMSAIIKQHDFEVWAHLEKLGVVPQYYAFRWILLMLSQEFELPDVLRLWDSFFSDKNRFDFLLFFCSAMVLNVRDTIVSGTFSASLSLLQNYPPTDFNILMTLATKLQQSTDPDILTNAIPTNATTPLVLDANDAMSLVVNDLDSIKTSIEQAARRRNRKRPTTTTTPASPLEPSQPHPLAPDTTSASSESTTTTTATSTVTTTPAIVIPTVLSPEPGGLSPAQTASFLKSLLE